MPSGTPKDTTATSSFWRRAELPFVELRTAHDATACYRLHTHPTLSIGIIDAGEALMTLVDRKVRLRAGDVVVISPGVVHACNRMASFFGWPAMPTRCPRWRNEIVSQA